MQRHNPFPRPFVGETRKRERKAVPPEVARELDRVVGRFDEEQGAGRWTRARHLAVKVLLAAAFAIVVVSAIVAVLDEGLGENRKVAPGAAAGAPPASPPAPGRPVTVDIVPQRSP